MSRRSRAIVFGALALVCAGLAAAVAGGYRGGVEAQLGPLEEVIVARAELPARRPLRPADVDRLLESRRVPARFVPPDALRDFNEAVGRAPVAPIPPGAYVTASQLRLPAAARPRTRPRIAGREVVEVTVTGAEALASGGSDRAGARVDVVVTTEPHAGGGPGRTYVAAEGVKLIGLREAGPGEDAAGLGPTGPTAWVATLAASRPAARALIHAHNYARELRLIAGR